MKQANNILLKKFQRIDSFATRKSFTVNGSETYRSTTGALLTILAYVFIAIYASNKAYKLSDRLETYH